MKQLYYNPLHNNYNFVFCRNCSVDARDRNQNTPLHIAAINNHIEAVRILVEINADVQLKDEYGDQPIHLALYHGHYKYDDYY